MEMVADLNNVCGLASTGNCIEFLDRRALCWHSCGFYCVCIGHIEKLTAGGRLLLQPIATSAQGIETEART
jgi:hypothetical protein